MYEEIDEKELRLYEHTVWRTLIFTQSAGEPTSTTDVTSLHIKRRIPKVLIAIELKDKGATLSSGFRFI